MAKILRLTAAILVVLTLVISQFTPVLAIGAADLAADSIGVTTLYAGIANTVVVNVSNKTTTAAAGFSVELQANGTTVSTISGQSISANNDPYYWPLVVSFSWTPAAAGDYTLTAIVDSTNAVAETDETNNSVIDAVTVQALSAVTVNVRVEGESSTLWSGDVTFTTSTITDKQGATHPIDHPTALGALAEAAEQGSFDFVVSSAWGTLSYIEQIGDDAPSGLNGWLYRVNWQSPSVAAVDYTLGNNANVLFYYGGWSAQPLRLSVDDNNVLSGDLFNITVEQYNDFSATWNPATNTTVQADSHRFTTDGDGKVLNVSLPPGEYNLLAEKEDYETYIRSNSATVLVYVPFDLATGWNFISFPRRLAAGNDTTAALFGGVDTASHSIFGYNPETGWISLGADDPVSPLEGIWIYAAEEKELRPVFETNPRSVPPTKQLMAGWNAVGYTDFSNATANATLTSVESTWAILIGFDSIKQAYDISIINNAPDGDSHAESRAMAPWKGYWLFLTSDSMLAAISS